MPQLGAWQMASCSRTAPATTRTADRATAPQNWSNGLSLSSVINNARRCIELIDQFGSLAACVWQFEPAARSRPSGLDQATLLQVSQSPESRR
jgi:DNA-3-methyladenine glycosylase I